MDGVKEQTISAIFQLLQQWKKKSAQGSDFTMRVSYLEIYNETINDLLNENNKGLEVRTGTNQDSYVQDLTEEEVKSDKYTYEWLERGEAVRKVAETKLNEVSSRSHSIFTIKLEMKNASKNGSVKRSEINLVDLAGSESVNRTKADGMRFREGANINKSLLALSNVIHDLSKASKKTKSFVSFRSSKLTRILQNGLSGNSKTSII